jgi:hypothetical protein
MKMSLRPMFRGAVLGLVLTAAAAAQEARVVNDPRTIAALRSEFDRAESLGLPVEPFVAKAREGYLKRGNDKQVRESMRNLADRMIRAREALKPIHSVAELEAGAVALQSGVTENVLRSLRSAGKTRSLEVPLGVLTELVTRQVPLPQAAARVKELMDRNATGAQMIAFGQGITSDIAAGLAPTVALDVRSRGVLSLLAAPAPAAALSPIRPPQ